MIKIGLTGSIGSGKSSIAKQAAQQLDIPVFDADRAVHELYAEDAGLQEFLIAKCGPEVVHKGQVDRAQLATILRAPDKKEIWREIEAEVHHRVWLRY